MPPVPPSLQSITPNNTFNSTATFLYRYLPRTGEASPTFCAYNNFDIMADFRPIAPFTQPTDQPDQSSTSSSAKQSSHSQESSGGTSGSGVAGAAGSHGNQSSAGSSRGSRDGTQRRRRVPGLVSSLACTECRRARAKVWKRNKPTERLSLD